MTIDEIIAKIQEKEPAAVAGIAKNKSKRLIQAVFAQMLRTIYAKGDGNLVIGGLGQFRVKKIERDEGGEKVLKKHIVFSGAQDKLLGSHIREKNAKGGARNSMQASGSPGSRQTDA